MVDEVEMPWCVIIMDKGGRAIEEGQGSELSENGAGVQRGGVAELPALLQLQLLSQNGMELGAK